MVTRSGAAARGDDLDLIAALDLGQLVDLQHEAEAAGWSARWPSVSALTREVGPGEPIYLRPIIRERKDQDGAALAYRTLVLFLDANSRRQPVVETLDVGGESLRALSLIGPHTQAGRAAVDLFSMAFRAVDVTPHDFD